MEHVIVIMNHSYNMKNVYKLKTDHKGWVQHAFATWFHEPHFFA